MKKIPKKEQIKRSRKFSDKIDYNTDIPVKITHVNPECKDARCCKPHGEIKSFVAYTAKVDFNFINKKRNYFLWKRDILIAVVSGIIIGFLLTIIL